MKITSVDKTHCLEIFHRGDENYSSFTVTVSVEIAHGSFFGGNIDVYFFNMIDFIKKLENFILNRKSAPRLNGTYESYIQFYQPDNITVTMIDFSLGDAFVGYTETSEYSLQGRFEIYSASLHQILKDFNDLEKAPRQTT